MTAPTHVISGLSFTVAFTHATGISPTGVQLLALLVGTLAPDIDGEGSITRPGTILRRFIGRGLADLLDAVFEFLTSLIQIVFSHRGFLHSPLFAFSLFVLAFILQQPWITYCEGATTDVSQERRAAMLKNTLSHVEHVRRKLGATFVWNSKHLLQQLDEGESLVDEVQDDVHAPPGTIVEFDARLSNLDSLLGDIEWQIKARGAEDFMQHFSFLVGHYMHRLAESELPLPRKQALLGKLEEANAAIHESYDAMRDPNRERSMLQHQVQQINALLRNFETQFGSPPERPSL